MSSIEPEPKHIEKMTPKELADLVSDQLNLDAARKIFDELGGDKIIVAQVDSTGQKPPEAQIIKKSV